jgi:ABC-type antimicrobial peptide transport system permease subunit
MRARADLRSRAASIVVLTLLTGLVGAVAMAAFAGARRTDSAYARFRQVTNEPDLITASCGNGLYPHLDLHKVEAFPSVASSAPYWLAVPVGAYLADGSTPLYDGLDAFDGTLAAPETADNPVVLRLREGRLPRGTNEVALAWAPNLARARVGDQVVIRKISATVSVQDLFSGKPPTADSFVPDVHAKVVGIFQSPNDLSGTDATILGSTAMYERYRGQAFSCQGRAIHLHEGLAGIPAFGAALTSLQPGAFYFDMSQEQVNAESATHLRAIVMTLFGWLTVIAGLLVVGQALVRRTVLGATDDPILRALGMSRRQVASIPLVSALIIGVGGAALALAGAITVSPFTVTGLAKMLEPDPGIRIDIPVLSIGAISIVAIVLLFTAVPAWRLAGARGGVAGTVELSGTSRPSRIAAAAASLGLSPSAIAGARLALEPGHGRTATPVRSAIAALALTIMAMVAAFGFAASMNHFIDTPRLWGVNFQVATGNPFSGSLFQDRAVPLLEHDPGLDRLTVGNFQTTGYLTSANGTIAATLWGLSGVDGPPLSPTMLEGRWPQTTHEIALGATTLRELGLQVGDRVHVVRAGNEADLTIVGVPVFPDFGFGAGFGDGAGLTFEGLQRLDPSTTQNLVMADYVPGTDQSAVMARVNPTLRKLNAQVVANDGAQLGDANKDAARSKNIPLILASLFTIVAFATLVHVLVTSVRRRRRDLAILRTIGFTRRQISRTVAWQAATIAVVGLAIGLPLGVLVGRLTWSLFAGQLGVVSVPVIAWARVIMLIPATIVIAVLISIPPAIAARRTRPAAVLRAE